MVETTYTNEVLDFEGFTVKVNGKCDYRFNYTYTFSKVFSTRSIVDLDIEIKSYEVVGDVPNWFAENPMGNILEYLENDIENYEGCYIESKCY